MLESDPLPGGIGVPDGYALVGGVSFDEEFKHIPVSDLQSKVIIENKLSGASVAFDQRTPTTGVLLARVIYDHSGRIYILRQDGDGVTTFRVDYGHNVL